MKISKFTNRDYTVIGPDITLKKIEEIMEHKNTKHVLILEDKQLMGIISDRDVKKYRSLFAETKVSLSRDNKTLEFKAHQMMSRNIITILEDTKGSEAITLMLKNNISCLPVLNRNNLIIGIVTRSEIMKWLVHLFNVIE